MCSPSSELPALPNGVKGYRQIHAYTLVQIILTVGVFVVTFTSAAAAFPVIIVALVPIRLRIMNRIWDVEVLKCGFTH